MIRPIGYFARTSRYPPARGPAGGTCAKFHGGVLLLRHVRGACGADAACILSLPWSYRLSCLPSRFQPFLGVLRDSNIYFFEHQLITSILAAPRQIHAPQSIQIPPARENIAILYVYQLYLDSTATFPNLIEPTSACGAVS